MRNAKGSRSIVLLTGLCIAVAPPVSNGISMFAFEEAVAAQVQSNSIGMPAASPAEMA